MPGFVPKAHSHHSSGAAFLGGMVTSHIIGGAVRRSERRTQAEEYQAYGQPVYPQQVYGQPIYPQQPTPAPVPQQTIQQRLDQLDRLAAGNYITKEEYQAKKKAIIDGL